jgi:hypothetical protein
MQSVSSCEGNVTTHGIEDEAASSRARVGFHLQSAASGKRLPGKPAPENMLD